MAGIWASFKHGRVDLKAARARNAGAISSVVGSVAGGVGSGISGGLKGLAYGLGRTGPGTFLAGAGILAGVVGVGTYLAMKPRGREFHEDDRQIAQIPPMMLTPQDLMQMQAPQMAMESGPAEGRDPYHFRNAVNASKGRSLEQPNPSQPALDGAFGAQQIG